MQSTEPTKTPARLPRKFGRYTLFDFIGRGGMAEIYLARAETELGATRLAVVKQILAAFADYPQFAEMLIHEAKLAAKLSHAQIVQVFDLGRADGQLFIAMEYVEGFDLNALLRRCTQEKVPLPVEFAMRIIADVLSGLDYAHRRTDDSGKPLGIVHRDVSPSNVLLSFEGEVKLCDFGIAHANDVVDTLDPESLGARDAIKGKAGYMSPEHARGEPIDARADVFATGILLWELIAGKRMYKPSSEVPLLDQARRAEIPDLPDRALANEAQLRAIVARALAPDRDARYPSAGAMQRDLDAYMADTKLTGSPLKLGEWMLAQFGTDSVSERRDAERRLPKSEPPQPNAPDGGEVPPSSQEVQFVKLVRPKPAMPVSSGAMRAFREELDSAKRDLPSGPGSLAGSAIDLEPASGESESPKEESPGPIAPPPASLRPVFFGLAVLVMLILAYAFFRSP